MSTSMIITKSNTHRGFNIYVYNPILFIIIFIYIVIDDDRTKHIGFVEYSSLQDGLIEMTAWGQSNTRPNALTISPIHNKHL